IRVCGVKMITENEKLEDKVPNKLLAIELTQCLKLKTLTFSHPVEFIYNPLEYAYDMHSNFIHKFCQTTKRILFLGMNPGPWGMSQTGVPFGQIAAVKDWLQVSGEVGRPEIEHPSRQVTGLNCTRSEVSGQRFWGFFRELCGSPEVFFKHAFVHNLCPLAFMSSSGKNVTPLELKAAERRSLYSICDESLREVVQLLQVEIIIGIGKFAETRANSAIKGLEHNIKVTSIPHPSPRNLGCKNWPQDVRKRLEELDLLSVLSPEHS
ncbi:hypothetical protein L9F63_009779, partial [Diploptera punctata]